MSLSAVLHRRQVDRPGQERGIGQHLAVHPEPGYPAIRIDRQPDVRPAMPVSDGVTVGRVAPCAGPGDQRLPRHPGQLSRRRIAVRAGRLDRDLRRVVPAEVRGVHHDPVHHPRGAEPHDRVVMPGLAAAPGLPAVVDLALVAERARGESRRLRLDQVLLLGEQLVVGEHHAPAQLAGSQVGQHGETGLRHRGAASLASSRPAGRSPDTAVPRSQVRRTTPDSGWPAYGVSRCR